MQPWTRLAEVARQLDGEGPVLWVRAPGRVNLMGDHTDYSEGLCLPAAIDYETRIAFRAASHGCIRIRSLTAGLDRVDRGTQRGGALPDPAAAAVLDPNQDLLSIDASLVDVPADASLAPHDVVPAWGRYVAGVVRALAERGICSTGVEAVLDSTLPPASGLSSSASLQVGIATMLRALAGQRLELVELATVCREAEQLATGVACGIMDPLVSLAGRAGHALRMDCRTLELHPVRLPDGLGVLAVHCGMPRRLEQSGYAQRREASERAARKLGLRALRDATAEQAAGDPLARHVVSENHRVDAFVEALALGDRGELGRIMAASHASLRDDFEVSTPQLDVLVEALVNAGAIGARLTGAGFGGCAVALVEAADMARIAAEATISYAERTGHTATTFPCRVAAGAGPAD